MKFKIPLILIGVLFSINIQAQKDLDIIYFIVDQYSCEDELPIQLRIKNEGAEAIPNFTININNEDGESFEKIVTTPLAPGEDRYEYLTVVPNKLFQSIYDVEILVEGDIDLSNNIKTNSTSNHLKGHNLELRISKGAYNSPRFEISLATGKNLIQGEFTTFQPNENYYIANLCLPLDTCYSFEITNAFKSNWCTPEMETKYNISSDPSHIYYPGDTVYSIVYMGPFFTGPLLHTILESYTAAEISSSEINTEFLVCDKPVDLPATISLFDVSEDKELFSFDYDPENNFFSEDFCLDKLDVGSSELPKSNSSFVFPNPSNGTIYLSSEQPIQSISISDQFGKVVMSKSGQINHLIDLKNQASGVYFINYMTNNTQHTSKIILEK